MISIAVFFLSLTAGSVFTGTFLRKDFGDMLPLSALGIILLLYVSGLFGLLKAGIYLILAATALLLLLSAIRLVRERRVVRYLRESFGAEGLCFLIFYVVLLALNCGRLAWHHDELSHWMECVKIMSSTDDFGANYLVSQSAYASYPPGMALFQYFFQKLHEILDGAAWFSEWRPYVAFQLFSFILFFPMLKKLKYHPAVKPVLFAIAMLIPMILYSDFFAVVLIDPVLGVMAGAAYVYLLTGEKRTDTEKTVYISMLCAVLVLIKDAGLFFAVFISAVYIPYMLMGKRPAGKRTEKVFMSFVPLLAALATKGSWKLVLWHFNTPLSFSSPIRIGEYLQIFFAGGDTTYRQETVDLYKRTFVDPGFYQIHSGITASYLAVLIILFLLLAVLTVLLARKEPEQRKRTVLLSGVLVLQTVLYIFFLGAVYIYKFNEFEGSTLACYERYIRIAYLPLLIVLAWMAFGRIQSLKNRWKNIIAAGMAGILLLLCPFKWLSGFVTRSSVQDSVNTREPFRILQETIESECSGNDTIAYISREKLRFDRNMIKFIARPNYVSHYFDQPQEAVQDDQWVKTEIIDRYTWIVTDQIDEKTAEMYKGFISGDEPLRSRTLYRVNHETSLLERIQLK